MVLFVLILTLGGINKPQFKMHDYPEANERGCTRMDVTVEKPGAVAIELASNSQPQIVCYRVMGPVRGFQIKDEFQPAVGDLAGLVANITEHAKSDREKAEALFRFVVQDIKDWYYPAQGIDLTVEDLGVLIWGFGFGFCYDLGRLQAGLWHSAGLRSRIVAWPQHTLAEVFYDDAWHLYDLQHRSFYIKPDGVVAGFAEIKANPKLLEQNLNEYGLDPIGYPPDHLAEWYRIAQPRFEDSREKPYWKAERTFEMDLRFGEFFEFVTSETPVAYHPDSWVQYYGEKTLRKDPPWLVQGRLTYAPSYLNQAAHWQPTKTPDGHKGFLVEMNSPFIFTEGWMRVKNMPGFNRVWIRVWGEDHFAGRMVEGRSLFSELIAGSNRFSVIVEADNPSALETAVIQTRLQLSPIGLPELRPGLNNIPMRFRKGRPHLTLWYQDQAPDLAFVNMAIKPPRPIVDQPSLVNYEVENRGGGASAPTLVKLFNNTTSLFSETTEWIGTQTIPTLQPGERHLIEFQWLTSDRMTWYGQDPQVQLLDVWLDMDRTTCDNNRENNRRQDYVLLGSAGAFDSLP